MKNRYNIFAFALVLTFISSCDEGFDELNTNKTGAIALDPAFVLNGATINSSFPAGILQYDLGIVQQVITPNSGVLAGANFNQVNPNNTPAIWTNYYRNVIKYTKDIIEKTKDVPARSNLMHMARIIQAHAFMIITDTYGNIPYVEGGTGYATQTFFPKYDKQEDIYPMIIQELTEASAALDPAGKIETADVLYGGNVAKWKKFGYSLLLRAGMRLSEVNPTLAADAVADAFAGGVITDNADNAVVRHDANFVNPVGNTLNSTEAANYYLAEPFVTALKTNNDPRLPAIAIRFVGATSGPTQTTGVATTAPANQYGMPMGSTDGTADAAGATLPGGGTRYAFSQVDRTRLIKRTSPTFLMTAAQTNLLLAEARFRNWIGTGTADAYFSTGVKAHIDQMVLYDPASAVSASDRDAYANARVGVFAGNELREINYEYWIASFLNGPEAWANFRRSDFPVLAPNPFSGRTVEFITRLTYPPSEILVNTTNVQEAIAAMDPTTKEDKLDTRVWWDQ
jgi:hypothetical protein